MRVPRIVSAIVVAAMVLLSASGTRADDARRAKRLRIAGWTTTAVGIAAFTGGLAYALANRCDERQPGCNGDDAFEKSLRGDFVLIAGVVTATAVGMPMLLRARKLSRPSSEASRELTITPGLTGLTISGRF